MMRTAAIVLTFAICIFPAAGKAQVTIDMSSIRCEQYLAMPPDQARDFSAWMSGYFKYKIGEAWVDLAAYQKNVVNVTAWCTHHPKDTVMSGLKLATGVK